MEMLEVLRTSIVGSIVFSLVGLPIACVSAFVFGTAFAPRIYRWHYILAGLLGGLGGEFCAVSSVFLSLSMWCSHHPQPCNDAQGGIVLIFLLPIGVIGGSLFACWWTRLTIKIPEKSVWTSIFIYSGPSRVLNWCCAMTVPVAICVLIIWMLALLMA